MKKTSDPNSENSLVKRTFNRFASFMTEVESEKRRENNSDIASVIALKNNHNNPTKMAEKVDQKKFSLSRSNNNQNKPAKMPEKAGVNESPKNNEDLHIASLPLQSATATKSYISSDVIIDGSVTLASDINIAGTINGDVTSASFIGVFGNIKGNVHCKNIVVEDAKIIGDMDVQDSVTICGETKIEGSLKAINITINSIIKGDVSASERLLLGNKAVIVGNIEARDLIVETGASINGSVKIIREDIEKPAKHE